MLMLARTCHMRKPRPGTPHQLTFWNSLHATPNATSYTWSSQNIGVADANRTVIVLGYAAGDGAFTNLGLTVGGLTASKILGASGTETMFAFYVIVPSGTTASLVFSNSSIIRILDTAFWTALLPPDEFNTGIASVNMSSGQTFNATVDIPSYGFALTMGFERANLADQTMTVNQNFIERREEFQAPTSSNCAWADLEVETEKKALNVTWTLNASSAKVGMVLASFGYGGPF